MDPIVVGILGIALLLIFFMLGLPVGFSMAAAGFLGFAYLTTGEAALGLVARDVFEQFTAYPLSVVPMFILMGTFAFASGISKRLYQTTYTWIGQFRGGVTMATVLACAGFAAICGSTAASAATMGKIALPAMRR